MEMRTVDHIFMLSPDGLLILHLGMDASLPIQGVQEVALVLQLQLFPHSFSSAWLVG